MQAILGGTFDPPHLGHLAVANAACEQLEIDVVRLIPAGEPWQKSGGYVSDTHHRLAMARLAAAEDRRFVVDDIEVVRSGPSYTMDTVVEIGGDLVLILGSDAAIGIPSWERGSDLLDAVTLAVVERPGTLIEDVERTLDISVERLVMPSIELSGTEIRRHIRAGFSPRFFVPDGVADYIESNRLYR